MAKSDFLTGPLLPVVLAAGVLSGSLLRPAPPADPGRAENSSVREAVIDAASSSSIWSELRPVIDTLAASMGQLQTELNELSWVQMSDEALPNAGAGRDRPLIGAMRDLENGLRTILDSPGS
jgi:hypothetical protein